MGKYLKISLIMQEMLCQIIMQLNEKQESAHLTGLFLSMLVKRINRQPIFSGIFLCFAEICELCRAQQVKGHCLTSWPLMGLGYRQCFDTFKAFKLMCTVYLWIRPWKYEWTPHTLGTLTATYCPGVWTVWLLSGAKLYFLLWSLFRNVVKQEVTHTFQM